MVQDEQPLAQGSPSFLNSATLIGVLLALLAVFFVRFVFLRKQTDGSSKKKRSGVALDPEKYLPFPLTQKTEVTHNTRIFRFGLPSPTSTLGLPIGQHISFRCIVDGKDVYRPYTPITSDDEKGYFELMIKVYPAGKMSQYMDKLKIGDTIEAKGPKGKFNYQPNMKKKIGMLAGGTGITPMLQIIKAVLKNPKDETQISLIFGNIKEEDILLREELEKLAAKHGEKFHLYFTLNDPPKEKWTQGVGFITPDMIKTHLPPPSEDNLTLLCGPEPMNVAMIKNLTTLGFEEKHYFKF